MESDVPAASLVTWIAETGEQCLRIEEFLSALGHEMNRRGLPIARIWHGRLPLNPLTWGKSVTWLQATNQCTHGSVSHQDSSNPAFRHGPSARARETGIPVRQRFDGTEEQSAMYQELKSLGMTDFLIMLISKRGLYTASVSYCTTESAGFSESHLQLFKAIRPVLAHVLHFYASHDLTSSLLETYLGQESGRRVLDGQIKRGDGQTIPAAILFADLRDFTGLSDRLAREELLDLLNDWFSCAVDAVEACGGQVLKFIGDGLLAIFDANSRTPAEACAAAMEATAKARELVDRKNQERTRLGKPPILFGLGLHFGEVMYGNIGSLHRLDFTVIGPAVNMAARLEGLCSKTGEFVVMSSTIAALAGRPVRNLGQYPLKGLEGEHDVFTPQPDLVRSWLSPE